MAGFRVNGDADNRRGAFSLCVASVWARKLKVLATPVWQSVLSPAGRGGAAGSLAPRASAGSRAGRELSALLAALHGARAASLALARWQGACHGRSWSTRASLRQPQPCRAAGRLRTKCVLHVSFLWGYSPSDKETLLEDGNAAFWVFRLGKAGQQKGGMVVRCVLFDVKAEGIKYGFGGESPLRCCCCVPSCSCT